MTQAQPRFILTLSCPSAAGQVAAVSGFLDARGGYIDELSVFDDELSQRFFIRCVFHTGNTDAALLPRLRAEFAPIAERFAMQWQLNDAAARTRTLILVSKLDHCLNDLLYRWKLGELALDIAGIVSNHPDLEPIARSYGLPYHHLPISAGTKAEQEAKLLQLVESTGSELVILARYMQILSNETAAQLSGRAINIHHSFLPGFKGAKPYHQAYARGVKLIGATAHYVTDDLDEGPIIEQVVERVDHTHKPEQLQATGRDMECLALARAVKYHTERRVFPNGDRTVVFR
ncbi:formyltetrahydrofolate deformylase [Crenobacter sp. SG2305]|uniref:formyltetrahydrofolate deformylase n=1 Tax=Crenobacter oryzisoli TaxID=3056844 RepID=UPI0025AA3863|nr:formyltetrahydrofolate deformylase [Crenobacter sp. SG2305]MDN0082805.1 formyltetrahydrofolate deformylase [Crenobacter sp. SG2305]